MINCRKCKKRINVNANYCVLEEFKGGEPISIGHYHTDCYRELIYRCKDIGNLKKKADTLIEKTSKILGSLEVGNKDI